MTIDNEKIPTVESEPENNPEVSEETLEELNGGGVGLFGNSYLRRHLPGMPKKPRKPMEPEEPEEPTDGGATGSW